MKRIRVGCVVDSGGAISRYSILKWPWQRFSPVARWRYMDVALYLKKTYPLLDIQLFDWNYPLRSMGQRCDVVIVLKRIDPTAIQAVKKFKQSGTKVIFDANVNYYESWGNHRHPGTEVSKETQENAIQMTSLADHVIADSSYIAEVCRRFNANVACVPDPVDTDVYRPAVLPRTTGQKLRLIWSGIPWKAYHFEPVLAALHDLRSKIDLMLVFDPIPGDPKVPIIEELQKRLPVQIARYTRPRWWGEPECQFPSLLQKADVIISPKVLDCAYDMGHTELKITQGMAAGLPAVASPQPSYKEALANNTGGWICETADEWHSRLSDLIQQRDQLAAAGGAARQRVVDHYSIPVIAHKYLDVILNCVGQKMPEYEPVNA